MIRKFAGWIETILGFFVIIGSIVGIYYARTISLIQVPDSFNLNISDLGLELTLEGLGAVIKNILSIIPIIIIAYSVIILLLGIHIFLEGLSKLEKKKKAK